MQGSFFCECSPGYIGDGQNCTACRPGYYKAVVGNSQPPTSIGLQAQDQAGPSADFVPEFCHSCPVNTFTNGSGATTCRDCKNNSLSPAASGHPTACECDVAFTGITICDNCSQYASCVCALRHWRLHTVCVCFAQTCLCPRMFFRSQWWNLYGVRCRHIQRCHRASRLHRV